MHQELAQALRELAAQHPGPLGFIGAADQGEALGASLVLDPVTSRKRLQARGAALVRGDAAYPPLARGCLGVVMTAGELGRQPDAATAVEAWLRLLRPGGALLVAEPESSRNLWRGLRRMVGAAPPFRPPQPICALLLNAGFPRVGQCVAPGRPRGGMTRGVRRR